jgi:hypothetical protein
MVTHPRRIKLIQPRLQLKLVLSFVGLSTLGLLLQFLLFASALARLAADLPNDGALVAEAITSHLLVVSAVSVVALLPLVSCVGVLLTFRLAGPLYRFEQHLAAIARGEDPGVCRIRQGDELQAFCKTLNAALDRLRAAPAVPSATEGGSTSTAALERAA